MSLSYTSASLIALLLEDGVALGDGRCEPSSHVRPPEEAHAGIEEVEFTVRPIEEETKPAPVLADDNMPTHRAVTPDAGRTPRGFFRV